jgi:hypothetical protein
LERECFRHGRTGNRRPTQGALPAHKRLAGSQPGRGRPSGSPNKAAHREFLGEFAALKEKFERDGITPLLAMELQTKLCGWLRTHIGKVDSKLRETVPA